MDRDEARAVVDEIQQVLQDNSYPASNPDVIVQLEALADKLHDAPAGITAIREKITRITALAREFYVDPPSDDRQNLHGAMLNACGALRLILDERSPSS